MNSDKVWLQSKRFDIALWIGTLAFSGGFIFLAGQIDAANHLSLWLFIALVVAFDVSHVYATLYRVYMDKKERKRRPKVYYGSILILYLLSVLTYAISPMLFFSLLAYYAVYHFIKQHYGFVALYKHKLKERSSFDYHLDRWTVFVGTGYPILWWHTHLPRNFSWFMDGDFIDLIGWITKPIDLMGVSQSAVETIQKITHFIFSEVFFVLYILVIVVYAIRQVFLYHKHGFFNPGKNLVMAGVWISWYMGIIHFNNDIIWNAFIILYHAIPYFALIWLYSTRKTMDQKNESQGKALRFLTTPRNWLFFYLFLFALGLIEEVFWDFFVWKQYLSPFLTGLFPSGAFWDSFSDSLLGRGEGWRLSTADRWHFILWVPLFTLPQILHYYLDSELWRFDGRNPDLRRYLQLED